ncbi:nicotinamide riboside transporter PnuC [Paraburkholderia atlantica]
MIVQGLFIAAGLMLTLQMMLFIMSPAMGLKAAFADSCYKTGKVIAHLFQIQRGPEQWIGFAAFGTVGIYVVIFAALDIVARFGH